MWCRHLKQASDQLSMTQASRLSAEEMTKECRKLRASLGDTEKDKDRLERGVKELTRELDQARRETTKLHKVGGLA